MHPIQFCFQELFSTPMKNRTLWCSESTTPCFLWYRINTSCWRENSFGPFCRGYISLRNGFPILGFRLGRVHLGGGNKSSGTFYHLLGDVGDPDQAQVFAEPAIFAAQALDAATDNDSTRLDIIIFMRERKIISVSTMLVAIIKWCWWW